MKIAFIGQKGVPVRFGGIEKHVDDLAAKLVKEGHKVYVYTRPNYTDKNLKKHKGVDLISLPSVSTKNFDAISHTFLACLDVVFRRRDVEVIHFHSIGPSSLIWLVRFLRPRTPVIATFHSQCYFHKKWGSFAKMYLKFGERVCCKFADSVIVVSKTLKKYAKDKYKVDAINIPNGVHSPNTLSAYLIKQEWGLERGSYFLYVSRLVKHKGAHYAIDAYKKLKTDKKLVIVGGGFFTDSYVQKIEEMAKDDPNIIITGSQTGDVLIELFSNAYSFIQPSESEGLSIALLEAMSYANAPLVSNIPENLEVVEDKGFIFENKNVDDLAKKMQYILDNPELVEKQGKRSKIHIHQNYNWDSISKDILDVYREARNNKNKKFFFGKQHREGVGL